MAKRDPIEDHKRQAVLQDQAGAAYASELSTATDPSRRDFLAKKAKRAKEQAAFHRSEAERLAAAKL